MKVYCSYVAKSLIIWPLDLQGAGVQVNRKAYSKSWVMSEADTVEHGTGDSTTGGIDDTSDQPRSRRSIKRVCSDQEMFYLCNKNYD